MNASATVDRDSDINALCPPHRVQDDRLYAEWVLNVVSTLPDRDANYIQADLDSWDAWKAEAVKVSAWLDLDHEARPTSTGETP